MSRSRTRRPVAVAAGLALSLLGSALAWRVNDSTSDTERVPVYAPADGQLVWTASGQFRGYVVPSDAERWMLEAEQAMQVAMAQSADEPIAVLPFGLEPLPLLGAPLPPEAPAPQPVPASTPPAEPEEFVDPVPAARQALKDAESALGEAEARLAAAKAIQPELAVRLSEAETQAVTDREKRDKNQRLFDLGVVSRKVLERSTARASESEAAAEAVRQEAAAAADAVAAAEKARDTEQARLEEAKNAWARAESVQRPAPQPPQKVAPEPQAPPPVMPAPRQQPPAPVAVMVDTAAKKFVEQRILLAQAKLAQAEALQRGIPVSVPQGEFIPLLASGTKVVAGQRVGWVRVRR